MKVYVKYKSIVLIVIFLVCHFSLFAQDTEPIRIQRIRIGDSSYLKYYDKSLNLNFVTGDSSAIMNHYPVPIEIESWESYEVGEFVNLIEKYKTQILSQYPQQVIYKHLDTLILVKSGGFFSDNISHASRFSFAYNEQKAILMNILLNNSSHTYRVRSVFNHEFGHILTMNHLSQIEDAWKLLIPDSFEYWEDVRLSGRSYDEEYYSKVNQIKNGFVTGYSQTNMLEDLAETADVALRANEEYESLILQSSIIKKKIELIYKLYESIDTAMDEDWFASVRISRSKIK